MNEPVKENPKTSKRSKRKPAMEPLGWDEIVSQPGMGGYLSFLNGPVPLPHLQGTVTASAPDPGSVSIPGSDTAPVILSPSEIVPTPAGAPSPRPDLNPSHTETIPDSVTYPAVVSTPPFHITPGVIHDIVAPTSEVVSTPVIVIGQRLRIRRCAATHDGHSLGEEVLYQALWKAATSESAETRMIVIGWRGMSQLCRMTPKNCKINTQRLIRKLALEVLSPYNTPESIGTTYRVHSDQAILQRRHDAGLEWVVRSRGVEFVDPATGISILPICAHTYQNGPLI
jgi:hypothetical protein